MVLSRLSNNLGFISHRPELLARAAANYALMALGRPRLRSLDIDLTYTCPCACEQCYSEGLERPGQRRLDAGEIASVVDQARKLGLMHVSLTGGEPHQRRDLCEVVRACQPGRVLVSMCSSGVRLNPARIRELRSAGLAMLILSLDSPDPATHDENRGVPGLFDRVMAAIPEARALGLRIMVNSVATREKLHGGDIEALYRLTRQLGVVLNLTVPVSMGRWEDADEVLLDARDRERFFELLRRPGLRTDTESAWRGHHCPAGSDKISVGAYGEVRACQLLPRSFGNVRETDLATLWRRMQPFADELREHRFCPAALETIDGGPRSRPAP
ncbi:MAG: radical SAM protein [Myxococcota bacterium]|nr:radical SAM protein [Myxococcota bacterium]